MTITTVTGTIALGSLGVLLIFPWLAWLMEYRAHRLEVIRHERTQYENRALNRLISEYEQSERTEEALSRHTATTVKLLAMQGRAYDPRKGREN